MAGGRKGGGGAEYIGPGEAARLLGLTPDRLRQIARAGDLPEAMRVSGKRVYRRRDVERFKRTRAKKS